MQKTGYYTGKRIIIQDKNGVNTEFVIGKISGYNGHGEPFYDILDAKTKEIVGDKLNRHIKPLLTKNFYKNNPI